MRNVSIAGILLFVAVTAAAHHSRAPFLLDETFETEGIVTEVSWRSPHIYLEVSATDADGNEEIWTYEGHSIAGLKRLGWVQDSIQVGDRVVVIANPNRDPEKRFGLLDNVTRSDGKTFYSFRIPDAENGGRSRPALAGSTDFSGYWNRIGTLRQAFIGGFGPPTGWPVTELGQQRVDAYEPEDDPALSCIERGMPGIILSPYTHQWTREADRIVITKDQTLQTRVIHLDGSRPPADYEPDALGYSVGRFEDENTLIVETTGFAPTAWGLTRGIDSSDQKRITERFELVDNGYEMRVSYTVEDPVYLREPATREGGYRKIAEHEFVDVECDIETARRHLQFE